MLRKGKRQREVLRFTITLHAIPMQMSVVSKETTFYVSFCPVNAEGECVSLHLRQRSWAAVNEPSSPCSPNLTWRDLQYVVLMTAKPGHLQARDWVTNAVGRRGRTLHCLP